MLSEALEVVDWALINYTKAVARTNDEVLDALRLCAQAILEKARQPLASRETSARSPFRLDRADNTSQLQLPNHRRGRRLCAT